MLLGASSTRAVAPLGWCEHAIPSSDAYRTEELPIQGGWSALHMLLLTLRKGEQVYSRQIINSFPAREQLIVLVVISRDHKGSSA